MNIIEIIQRIFNRVPIYLVQFKTLVKKEGVFFTFKRASKKIFRFLHSRGRVGDLNRILFKEWMSNVESVYLNQKSMKEDLSKLKVKPKFSIIFPVWNKSEEMLQSALDSITDQVYDNWEICISDGSSKGVKESKEFLERFKKEYPKRVKLSFLSEELRDGINIIENSNNAINMATGQYLVFMDCDDEISPNCLLELAKGINMNPKVDFLYSDFDKIDERGNRFDPSFWPDWSPHTLTAQMYTTHVTCYKREVVKELGGLVKGTHGAQDWDLVLRYVTRGNWNVIHIPKILYHWRVYPGSTALSNSGAKNWAYENQRGVLERYLERRKLKGEVLEGPFEGSWRVKFDIIGNPKVSIVIPTKDKVEYLKRAIESIEEHTKYRNYEIVIIDNRSEEEETKAYFEEIKKRGVKVLEYDMPFHFGKLYNWASKQVDGEYMLILNNDIKVLNELWLESMLEWCQLPEVGSVGAKLYYPNGKIQHAGVIVGAGGAAAHSHRLMDGDTFGYNGAVVNVRNYLALTAACLMVKRKTFLDMNGFNEVFDPAYQDVDFGIRLFEKRLYNVYTPYAELIHYESVSRLDS
ncbi:MAG TPA: glycosyltransferase, partial [Candidatus Dojkabacteria bacterium]|nr:glycosyltransferase [Candidatus Dojkabacteria bacterium]